MDYSSAFSKIAGATVIAGGLAGCGTMSPPVNSTTHEPAVANQVVKVDRCADNGFHVAQANPYNMAQVQQSNPAYHRYGNGYSQGLLGNIFGTSGVSSQLLYTANGPYIIQYPQSFGIDSGVFSKLVGGLVGASVGGGYGRVVGAALGAQFLGPIFGQASDIVTQPALRARLIKLAECTSDTLAQNGGPVAVGAPVGGRGFIGNPGPRPTR